MKFYLFGVAAAGKNYVGELLQRSRGIKFVDADPWITSNAQIMGEFKAKGAFTQEMRDRVHTIIAANITALSADGHADVAIAQASLKARNRQQLMLAHPDLVMVHVYADEDTLLDRVAKRGNFVTPEHVKTMLQNFDAPTQGFAINSAVSDDAILAQFDAIVKQLSLKPSRVRPKL